MSDKQAEASETIAADPDTLYDLVSDLTQMGKWSPEASGGRWVGGATGPAVGAKFLGNNRSGWRRWSTSSEITAADRGKRFAFRVTVRPGPRSPTGPMTSSRTATAPGSSSAGPTFARAGWTCCPGR